MLVADPFEAPLRRKARGSASDQEDATPVVEDVPGDADRIGDASQGSHRAGPQIAPVHDGGIHLDERIGVQDRAVAGVEQRVVLEQRDTVRDDA